MPHFTRPGAANPLCCECAGRFSGFGLSLANVLRSILGTLRASVRHELCESIERAILGTVHGANALMSVFTQFDGGVFTLFDGRRRA